MAEYGRYGKKGNRTNRSRSPQPTARGGRGGPARTAPQTADERVCGRACVSFTPGYEATTKEETGSTLPSLCCKQTLVMMARGVGDRAAPADHSSGNVAPAEAGPDSSSNSGEGGGLNSVEAVFGWQQEKCKGPVAARANMFQNNHPCPSRAAAVRQQDIPDVLKCMSEMRIFSSSASKTAEADASLTGEYALPREPDQAAVVYDVDALRAAFVAVKQAFPPHWNHCVAIKACPLPLVIQEALDAGLGIEAASFVELYLGLAHGCPADLAAFDSPAKTNEELEMALSRGTLINANSLDELERIDAIIKRKDSPTTARVGIRLNPLVGAGSIAELSVSVVSSKFAVPTTPANVLAVVEAFRKWPWLVGLHTHVGSQGCSLDQLASGGAALCEIADVIDGALGKGRVTLLDIGGGLPANYDSEEVSPAFSEYAAVLKNAAPSLFENTERIVVTEFGKALLAKVAMTVSTVEYVRSNASERASAAENDGAENDGAPAPENTSAAAVGCEGVLSESTLCSPDYQTLVTHVGADLFLRTSYCPGKFSHRLSVHNRSGAPLGGPLITTDVAGPLCFQGDYLARGANLPRVAPGDLLVVRDTGANTLSLFSRHCSRRSPAVYGYMRDGKGKICVRLVKEKESVRDVARFWGVW